MVCNKCGEDQTIDNFETYFHSNHNKHFTRRICRPCMRIGYKEYKLRVKEEKRIKHLLVNGGKKCSVCNELKLPDQYYANRTLCKECVKHIEREKDRVEREKRDQQRLEDGISNKRVPNKPGHYADEIQRTSTHELLTLIGWSYNPINNLYFKEPLKSATGFWRSIKPNLNNSRVEMNRKRKRIREWLSEDTLPKLTMDKHRRKITPPDEIINKCMYDYFVGMKPGYMVAYENGVSETYVTHYIVKIYDMLYDKFE